MKRIIKTTDAPEAIGPYSQAVNAGNFLFVSGQLPIDPLTGKIVENDIEAQTIQSIKNLKAIVEASGKSLEDIVKVNVYLLDMKNFAAMNSVYASFFKKDCPARAAVQVARLPLDAQIEIEAVAYKE